MLRSRSFVMVKPFHNTSIRLDFSSASLLSQSIDLNSTSEPIRFATSFARSISKPTSSPFSSLNPIGGKLSSKPMTIFFGTSVFACFVDAPQPATNPTITNALAAANTVLEHFCNQFIILSPLYSYVISIS